MAIFPVGWCEANGYPLTPPIKPVCEYTHTHTHIYCLTLYCCGVCVCVCVYCHDLYTPLLLRWGYHWVGVPALKMICVYFWSCVCGKGVQAYICVLFCHVCQSLGVINVKTNVFPSICVYGLCNDMYCMCVCVCVCVVCVLFFSMEQVFRVTLCVFVCVHVHACWRLGREGVDEVGWIMHLTSLAPKNTLSLSLSFPSLSLTCED